MLLIQLVGLVLAFIFGFIEATALLDENNIVFILTNAAWPLSMLWMIVVGITVVRARRLSGWQRFVPLLCPFWLVLAIAGSAVFSDAAGGIVGFGYAAVLWVLLGYIVLSNSQQPSPTPRPAVQ